jgi:hypothetical protein
MGKDIRNKDTTTVSLEKIVIDASPDKVYEKLAGNLPHLFRYQ